MHRLTRYSAVTLIGLLSFASIAAAEDWPTWRHDAGRTNISAEKIPAPLRLQWKRQLPPVTPAFRKSRLQFDQGYEPIVLGDTMYVALPHIDAVVAYAVETGKEKWRFYTAGPVRLAPVAWRDKLYFGSDDGHLYCLNASDGALRWKFRAVPSARKILGNGRLISVWPVRGGPVLDRLFRCRSLAFGGRLCLRARRPVGPGRMGQRSLRNIVWQATARGCRSVGRTLSARILVG